MWFTVHGDGFTLLVSGLDLDRFEREARENFEVKARGVLGPRGVTRKQPRRMRLHGTIELARDVS
eukprot:6162837-Pyramimonas_sp.AAC.1